MTSSRRAWLQRMGALAASGLSMNSAPALALPRWNLLPSSVSNGTWDPARTWVFSVGILQWQDSEHYHSFPTAGRKDAELLRAFRSRGVPANQLVSLTDRGASRAAILSALEQFLPRAQPGDLLWFYYAGHGVREENGETYFIPNDARAGQLETTGWSITSLFNSIEQRFRGGYALLTADCCYSGALANTAARRRGSTSYACLSSSLSSEESTGAWTFTESLLAGITGNGTADVQRDGRIALEELATFTERQMAFLEEQLSSFAVTGSFPRGLQLGPAQALASGRIGEHIETNWQGQWYKSIVRAVRGNELRVHYAGYPDTDDEWVTPDRVRPYQPRRIAAGTPVEVRWRDRWWPARVLTERQGIHHIHYDNYSDVWDEWVSSRRIRVPGEPTRANPRRRT